MDAKPKVSIVFPTRNRPNELIECLKSVFRQAYLPSELIVIDASRTQNVVKIEDLRKPPSMILRYIYFEPGANRARNLGIDVCQGDIVLFLDDDVILDENFLLETVRTLTNEKYKNVGGMTGYVTDSSRVQNKLKASIGRVLLSIFFLPRSGTGYFQLSGFPTIPISSDKMVYSEVFPTSNIAFRMEVLKKYRFDERFDEHISETGEVFKGAGHADDDDMAYRVSREYRIIYNPSAKLIHKKTLVTSYKRTRKYVYYRNLIAKEYYFLAKNFGLTLQRRLAFSLSIIGLFLIELLTSRDRVRGVKGILDGIRDCIQKYGCARFVQH